MNGKSGGFGGDAGFEQVELSGGVIALVVGGVEDARLAERLDDG